MALNELYGTHQEAIHWALNKLATKDLKIYELGAGHFSTQLLHNATTNKLVTIETDLEWLKMFRLLESSTSSPTSPIHEFIYIDPYQQLFFQVYQFRYLQVSLFQQFLF